MPPTIAFSEIVVDRARRDPEFRELMLASGVQCLLAGEVVVAKLTLRDYIESTMGYEKLGDLTDTPPKKLASMFENEAIVTADDLLKVIVHIQQHEGIQFEVKVVPAETEVEDVEEVEAAAAH